jgi:hypothetical protein
MLARRLTTILPAMTLAEAIETTRIHSVAGLTGDRTTLVTTRPSRAPHHTISDAGLIGGGHVPTPGEVADIPHCLFHFWEYSAVESFIRFSKEFEPLLMLLSEIQHHRPLPRDEEPMDPDKILEDPPRRRVLHGVPLLVRKRCAVVLEGLANAVLQCGIAQQPHRHHH